MYNKISTIRKAYYLETQSVFERCRSSRSRGLPSIKQVFIGDSDFKVSILKLRRVWPIYTSMLESRLSVIFVSFLMLKEADSSTVKDFSVGSGIKEPAPVTTWIGITMEAVADDQ